MIVICAVFVKSCFHVCDECLLNVWTVIRVYILWRKHLRSHRHRRFLKKTNVLLFVWLFLVSYSKISAWASWIFLRLGCSLIFSNYCRSFVLVYWGVLGNRCKFLVRVLFLTPLPPGNTETQWWHVFFFERWALFLRNFVYARFWISLIHISGKRKQVSLLKSSLLLASLTLVLFYVI